MAMEEATLSRPTARSDFCGADMREQVITIRPTVEDEIPRVAVLESVHGDGFVLRYPLERHYREFRRPDVLYKSVYRGNELIGFAILVLDPDGVSVEFRRVVIAESGRGHGSTVVSMVTDLVRGDLGRTRLWLDVFEDNVRAQHVYERCGYQRRGRADHDGRSLLLYERFV